jgi:hypothetical protein
MGYESVYRTVKDSGRKGRIIHPGTVLGKAHDVLTACFHPTEVQGGSFEGGDRLCYPCPFDPGR